MSARTRRGGSGPKTPPHAGCRRRARPQARPLRLCRRHGRNRAVQLRPACGTLKVRGQDVGAILIAEGLAEPYGCGTASCPSRGTWCSS